MEGKEANRRKDFSQEYGEGTAVTLRLTKEYYGTGRVVYAGSAKWMDKILKTHSVLMAKPIRARTLP